MEKADLHTLPQKLSGAFSNIEADFEIINSTGNASQFAVFIRSQGAPREWPLGHGCIEVDDLVGFLKTSSISWSELLAAFLRWRLPALRGVESRRDESG